MTDLINDIRRWVDALDRRQAFDPKRLAALLRRIADYLEDHICAPTPDTTAPPEPSPPACND